jgi:DNA polymerase III alpha subunit
MRCCPPFCRAPDCRRTAHGVDDASTLAGLQALGQRHALPLVASGDVHMHARGRRALQDALSAIRLGCTIAEAGHALFPNGERHLRRREDLAAIYPAELLAESGRIAARCRFNLRGINYVYPHELVPPGVRAIDHLRSSPRWCTPLATRIPAKVVASSNTSLSSSRNSVTSISS